MKKRKFKFKHIGPLICILFLLICSADGFGQGGRAAGTYTFTEGLNGWTKINWETRYHFELTTAGAPAILFYTTDYKMTIPRDARYRYEGKEYTPSDLGVSGWPAESEEDYMNLTLDIRYKGQTIRHDDSYQLVNYPLLVGTFDGYVTPADYQNNVRSAYIGKVRIPYDGFSISDVTASLSGFTKRNSELASTEIMELVNKKITAQRTPEAKTSGSIQIGSGSAASTNQTVRNSGTTASTNDANARYQQELSKYNAIMKDEETKRNAQFEQSKQTAGAITEFTGAVINNIMQQSARNQEQREAAAEKARMIRQQNEDKANLALKYFLPEAASGNENAIAKSAEAYSLLEDPAKYIYEIGHDGYYSQYKPVTYLAFLTQMYNDHESAYAQKELQNYYTNVIGGFKKVNKLHKRKAYSRTIWGLILGAGGFIGSNYLLNHMDLIPDEKTFNTVHDVGASTLVLSGAVLCISGLAQFAQTGYKREPEYIDANNKLGILKRFSVSFSPTYDLINKNYGVSMRLKF